ncbi:MAG: universal stress protein [Pseudomonadota bacterium]
MTDDTQSSSASAQSQTSAKPSLVARFEHGGPAVKFLVIAQDCAEAHLAAYFAARRARYSNAQVTLLHIIEPGEYAHWQTVAEAMRAEAYDHAEELLAVFAREVEEQWGHRPEMHIREGRLIDEIRQMIEGDAAIAVLFLGASINPDGPGPLVTALAQSPSYFGDRPVPVTVVPGSLSKEDIIAMAG